MAQDLSLYRGGETQRSWDPSPLLTLHREMSRLFDDVFLGAVAGQQHDAGSISAPRIDISETDKELRITADLPGVDEENVQVTVDDDVLTIRGETRLEREEERKNYRGPGTRPRRVPALDPPARPGGPRAGEGQLRERGPDPRHSQARPGRTGPPGAHRRRRLQPPGAG